MLLWAFVAAACLASVTARSMSDVEQGEKSHSSPQENLVTVTDPYVVMNDPANADCQCKDGYCVETRGKMVCNCYKGWGRIWDSDTKSIYCGRCDCGGDYGCEFATQTIPRHKIIKKCLCPDGFKEIRGKCLDCDCKDGYCEDDGNNYVCKCREGWGLNKGNSTFCKKCDCVGDNNCNFDIDVSGDSIKTCLCPDGYEDIEGQCTGTCKKNPCLNEGRCVVMGKDIECRCVEPYAGDRCQVCNCGDGYCEEMNGRLICKCHKGWGKVSLYPYCKKCDCRNDNNCTFTTNNGRITGKTCLCEYGYEANDGECIGTCKKNPCQNGGECNVKGKDIECKCTSPFAGNLCEKVDKCIEKCGVSFDTKGGAVECKNGPSGDVRCICTESDKVFDEEEGDCRETCEDGRKCLNGGKCQKRGTGNSFSKPWLCVCLDGTKGSFCEKVSKCDHKDCGDEATCSLEPTTGNVFCKCHNVLMIFDEKEGKCKETCEDDTKCLNGGKCEESDTGAFCACKEGTEGSFCENIPKCYHKDCGDEATCSFEPTTESVYCKCHNQLQSYDENEGKCRETCKDDANCFNGGICKERATGRFCVCMDGTEGSFCEKIPECYHKDCGDQATCLFAEGNVFCKCHNDLLIFDEKEGKCKATCKDDTNCFNGGKCSERGTGKFCVCKDGTEGSFCEKIPKCHQKNCGDEAACSFEPTGGYVFCKCYKELMNFDEKERRCKDACSDHPCQNGGTCLVVGNSFKCVCQDPFSGKNCETDPCMWYPCKNGGICKVENNAAKCFCKEPFTGKFCDSRADPCTSNPCMNGGLCKIDGTTFRCDCHQPFTGRLCEKDPCSDYPCQNGGTCFVVRNSFKCICQDTFAGNNCESNLCMWHTCKNGGICKVENNAAKCFCKEPYSGEFCDSRTDPCMWYPCKNGGICKFENNAATCYCKEPFTGEFCDSRTEIDATFITFAAIAVVLVFVAGMLCRRIHDSKSS